jgi:inorganic pyrophosphatase
MPEEPRSTDVSIDVLVEQSGGDCNRYAYDARAGAVRLIEVLHPPEHHGADRGIIPHTLMPNGEPFPVIVMTHQHVSPGALLRVRPLALVESATMTAVIGVPTEDPAFAHHRELDDIAPSEREGIEELFPTAVRWQGRNAAIEQIRLARERAARAARSRATAPQWMASRLHGSGTAADIYTAAEHGLRGLPSRFQRYVADCLLPVERILAFLSRPATVGRAAGWSFWRPRSLAEGLLVITDRQILWMTDALPPDATLVQWGYVAHTAAVERLTEIHLSSAGQSFFLEVHAAAANGEETISIEFPGEARDQLDETVNLLQRFIPPAETRAVRRLYQLNPEELGRGNSGENAPAIPDDAARRLLPTLPAPVSSSSGAVTAYIPPGSRRPIGYLLVVAGEHIAVVEDRPSPSAAVYPVANLSSLRLHCSLVSCSLELCQPAGQLVQRTTIPFDYPQREAVLTVFRATRQLLGQPPCHRAAMVEGADVWHERKRPEKGREVMR